MLRRRFLKNSILAAGSTALSTYLPIFAFGAVPKRILVLGGTRFLGPAVAEAALAGGHTVTLFNRGISNPSLFPYLEKVRGFRSEAPANQNLSGLVNRTWDAVIDVWPYEPAVVESAAGFLKSHTKHYLYVSSIAAYDGKNYSQPGITEDASLSPWDGPERVYKRGKAESERRLSRIVGERLTIVRPGPIKGDRDTATDLYTWLRRAQQGGKHIAPGDGNEYVQLVDVIDVARFLIQAIDASLYGTYNLTGKPMTYREFLQNCSAAVRSDAEFVWVSRDFLKAHNADSEGHMPLWRPNASDHAVFQISSQKAFSAGWQPRPFNETAFDCLAYFSLLDPVNGFDWQDPLSPAREKELLKQWQSDGS